MCRDDQTLNICMGKAGSFTASMRRFKTKVREKQTAVFRQSVQDVMEDAQTPVQQGGRMHVDTGFLRASLQSSLNGTTALSGPDSYSLAIATASFGDTYFGGWTASYAKAREFGSRGQAPDFFMRGAAQKWQAIVRANARKIKDD